jgi:lysyl-tRNA synthetase, class II
MNEPKNPPPKEPDTAADSFKRLDQDIAREENFRKLVEAGYDPFPHTFTGTHDVEGIVERYAALGKEELDERKIRVKVPGRIMTVRRMGKATFFHISDGRRRLQVYIREDMVGAGRYGHFSLFDIGDMIAVEGVLFKTRTGELTVLCDGFTFLAKCLHPLPEKWHGLQDVEIRYRRRYLDLIMNPEVMDVFRLRSALVSRIRRFFDERGYIEVETPMMHAIPGGALARPFITHHNALDTDLYLRVAPELYLKRLVVGGMNKVYEINRNFRNEGIDAEHNPEFTMLEFYEAFRNYEDMMTMTEDLLTDLASALLGKAELTYGEHTISLQRPFRRIKFMEAISTHSGMAPEKFGDPDAVIKAAEALAPEKKPLTFGKALDIIFDKHVKPHIVQPTFIINPPKDVSPLAKAAKDDLSEACRFELMIDGMEIANAFSELTDPAEQRLRFEQQAAERRKGDDESHPIDADYVQALEYGLPPTGGEGIGIDRLVMLFANRKSIREVILFPLLKSRE